MIDVPETARYLVPAVAPALFLLTGAVRLDTAWRAAAVAALATYGVAGGPALAYALGLQALQLVVGIVAGLVAMSAQDMSLAELAGRSRQAAAALRAAEPKVPAAEGSAAP